jgi:hypothetical protein
MLGNLTLNYVLWDVTFLLNAGLVVVLISRKNHRVFPFFSAYILVNFFHGIIVFETYRHWGFLSSEAKEIAWSAQGLVTLLRAAAVAEICYLVLAKFSGIWRLAWRLLAGSAALVARYTWAVSRGGLQFTILNLDRSFELVMAAVIPLMFVFSRYYEVAVPQAIRTLAIGFFLFSGFRVLDDSILERWLHAYAPLWNLLGTMTFLASLLICVSAARLTQQQIMSEPELLPKDHYQSLSPAINARLKNLNERLGHYWGAEGGKI